MIEIKNKTKGPVQLVVRSRVAPRAFTTLNIPGIGNGRNVVILEEERIVEKVLERLVKTEMVSTRYVETKLVKGE